MEIIAGIAAVALAVWAYIKHLRSELDKSKREVAEKEVEGNVKVKEHEAKKAGEKASDSVSRFRALMDELRKGPRK